MNQLVEPNHEVFLNVRKAYRLLHDYQQMLIDIVRYIGSQIDIPEWGGESKFAEDSRKGYRYLWQSSWDWLPMMGWCFHFTKERGSNELVSLSFLIISDTGFIDGDETENDKAVTVAYASAAESSSELAFFLYDTHVHRFSIDVINVTDKKRMREFIRTGGGLPEGVVGKCYKMTCLTNEAEVNKIILDIEILAKEKWPLLDLRRGSIKSDLRGCSEPEQRG